MTLIVLNYSVFGAPFGAGAQAARLVRALARCANLVHVLSADGSDVAAMSGVEGVTVNVIPAPYFRSGLIGWLETIRWHLVAALTLRQIVRAGDICIVGHNYSLLPLVVRLACTFSGAKVVHWFADDPASAEDNSGNDRLLKRRRSYRDRLRNFALQRADAIVASTAQNAWRAATICRIPSERIMLLEQPLQPLAIRPIDPASSPVRSEWGFQAEFVVGCCCEFLDEMGLQIVLDSADRLAQRRNIVFVFIGGGPMRADIEAETQRRSLANIRLPPQRPPSQLADCLAAADIHLVSLPTGADPFVIPAHFYPIAAAGRPTIFVGDPSAEVARLVTRAKCGASVKTAERLQWWIEDLRRWTLLRNDMGAKARTLFETRSNPNTWIDEWQSLLSTLASMRQREPTFPTALRMFVDFRKKNSAKNTRAPRQS